MTDRLGRYELLGALGQGGMAEVWRARIRGAAGFQAEVALKVIRTEMAMDEAHISMFVDEACLSARLKHPNIVATLDFGRVSERYFIALELIEGVPLRAAARRRLPETLTRDEALYIVAEVAAALEYAHNVPGEDGTPLRLVHRDVNPTNVLITTHGHVKLNDFGIAKATSTSNLTTAGVLKGKLAYMAPEQAWGRAVDGRTDVYALGLTLQELLTGQRALVGEDELTVLESARQGTLRDLEGRAPEDVIAVVKRAVAFDPVERYQTAGEMRAALLALLGDASLFAIQQSLGALAVETRAAEARVFAASPPLRPIDPATIATLAPATESGDTRVGRRTPTPEPPPQPRSAWWLGVVVFPIAVAGGWWVRVSRTPVAPEVASRAPAPVVPAVVTAPVIASPIGPPVVAPTPVAPTPIATHVVDHRPGVVRISAEPWAEVWVDGKSLGMTPLAPIELQPGRHDVRAKNPELGERRQSVLVAPGSSRLVKISFSR